MFTYYKKDSFSLNNLYRYNEYGIKLTNWRNHEEIISNYINYAYAA